VCRTCVCERYRAQASLRSLLAPFGGRADLRLVDASGRSLCADLVAADAGVEDGQTLLVADLGRRDGGGGGARAPVRRYAEGTLAVTLTL